MATSSASTVEQYLDELPDDRRELVGLIRGVVNANLPEGYQEAMQYGMIGWSVPHERYPAGYHTDPSQPLPFVALASQKRYVSLYLMGTYCGCADDGTGETEEMSWFRDAWTATGRKLDMGRSCVRVRKPDDVALDVVGEAVRRLPVDEFVTRYEAARRPARSGGTAERVGRRHPGRGDDR